MNKEQFLFQLRQELSSLPEEEVDNALEYYQEYLEDAGPENEDAAIASWCSPSKIASRLRAEYEMKQVVSNQSNKKGLSAVWVAVLAIFASPIAIPLAATLVVLVLTLALVVIVLIVCMGIVAFSVAISGLVSVAAGLGLITSSFSTFLFYTGSGLVLVGIGVGICPFIVWVSKSAFREIATLISKYIPRRKLL
jgi:uncharacterized membrane protein